MGPLRRDDTAREVDALFTEWRRKATDALLAVSVVLYLPAVALGVLRSDLPMTSLARVGIAACYLVGVVAAIARGIDYRLRGRAVLVAAYVTATISLIALAGPFARAAPIAFPVLALVLIGVRAGRIATAVSAALFLVGPLDLLPPWLLGLFARGAHPFLATPLPAGVAAVHATALIGLLLALMLPLERFHLFLLETLAVARGTSLQLVQEAAARGRLEREVARAGDQERCRLGQEIHDGVCQELTGALLRGHALARRLHSGIAPTADDLNALNARLQHAIDEAQAVAQGLWPLEADPQALARGLRTLVRQTREAGGGRCEFCTTGSVDAPDPEVAQHLYRIAQEAVRNAVRHARAASILVELRGEGEMLLLQIHDDGDGLPARLTSDGLGLRSMAYRAHLLEGELTVEPGPDGGTRVRCRAPRTLPARRSDAERNYAHAA